LFNGWTRRPASEFVADRGRAGGTASRFRMSAVEEAPVAKRATATAAQGGFRVPKVVREMAAGGLSCMIASSSTLRGGRPAIVG